MTRRRYTRLYAPDPRDRKYAVRVERRHGRKLWNEGRIWLDQFQTPFCVGHAWAHWLLGDPLRQYLSPAGIYLAAQRCDEWAGEDYEGTSVRAGAKVLAEFGFIERYEWAFDVDALVSAVLTTGPVVVGTNWYAGMNNPAATRNDGGQWRVKGRMLGGHAWNITGVDTAREEFRTRNSHEGNQRGYLSFADAQRLIEEDGEVCLAIEVQSLPKAA